MPQPRVKLVVTGDDFGYCPRRNRGIVDCFVAGALSNVSLLVNGSAAEHAADLARRHQIPAGLHANLSEGLPVCQKLRRRSTLVNEDGFFLGKMGFRKALRSGRLSAAEVELELRAQVEQFSELTGHLPQHMDGHQHVHVLPEVRDVFARVLSDYGIPFTRVPVEPGLRTCPWLTPPLQEFYMQVEEDAWGSVGVFRKHGIRWPSVYLGLTTMGKNMSLSSIKRAIDNALEASCPGSCGVLPQCDTPWGPGAGTRDCPITVELMVHPGYPSDPQQGGCGEGPDSFSQSLDRQHELDTLMDPKLLNFYRQEQIQLCAFKDL
ncbi:carbohydrate deacetylase isoform X1 [Scleropages formosus]|uniref:Carbohydrate deacetylase n=2 Tax=Scleropages formosus TaxID=113540 RepID=A0A8C9S0J0_SCLFO|nr:carbohydrate deacetylase isoform X1 [Scleropages formosus]XP_018584173.1 carbohydrate deacetylase isoform X1 [Scleropages formosus]XP_018584174.1 carbohydrate deacetylase isoform X1 [Scleropages formosus]XP_018584175.1 carbohydrate deacetylase isoform X1 [Scleropages formosus]